MPTRVPIVVFDNILVVLVVSPIVVDLPAYKETIYHFYGPSYIGDIVESYLLASVYWTSYVD